MNPGPHQSKAPSFEFKVIGVLLVESGVPHQSQAPSSGCRLIKELWF